MRKIDQYSANAFMRATTTQTIGNNTRIEVLPNVTVMYLHESAIAYRYNDPDRTLSVTTAGYPTNTTLSRLNAIPGVEVRKKQGKLYLNGEEWDGELRDVN